MESSSSFRKALALHTMFSRALLLFCPVFMLLRACCFCSLRQLCCMLLMCSTSEPAPSDPDYLAFKSYKGWAVNVLALCDWETRYLWISDVCSGNMVDSTVWKNGLPSCMSFHCAR